jgi:HAD superfamily hydrolase (TIGR01509 family)
MNAKAFFFDAHGVLYYRPHGDSYLESFLKDHGIVADVTAAKKRIAHLHDQTMRGKLKLQEYRTVWLNICGVTEAGLIEKGLTALQKDQANIMLYEGVIETIQTLKARKIKVGIVTDAAVTKLCKLNWLRSCGLSIVWDAYANSMDLGTRKPDHLMYQYALLQARITPIDSVFVGHAPHELWGARQIGFTTVAFNPDPGAEADYTIECISGLLELPLWQDV